MGQRAVNYTSDHEPHTTCGDEFAMHHPNGFSCRTSTSNATTAARGITAAASICRPAFAVMNSFFGSVSNAEPAPYRCNALDRPSTNGRS